MRLEAASADFFSSAAAGDLGDGSTTGSMHFAVLEKKYTYIHFAVRGGDRILSGLGRYNFDMKRVNFF